MARRDPGLERFGVIVSHRGQRHGALLFAPNADCPLYHQGPAKTYRAPGAATATMLHAAGVASPPRPFHENG